MGNQNKSSQQNNGDRPAAGAPIVQEKPNAADEADQESSSTASQGLSIVEPETFPQYHPAEPIDSIDSVPYYGYYRNAPYDSSIARSRALAYALVSACTLIAIIGATLGVFLIIQQGDRHPLLGAVVVAASIGVPVVVFYIGIYFIRNEQSGRSTAAGELTENRAQPVDTSPRFMPSDDARRAAIEDEERRINRQTLKQYQEVARRQASSSYRISQMAMVVGLAIIVAGAYVVVRNASSPGAQLVVGGLSALGGAFSAYIAATFIRTYNQAQAQMNFYYAQPLVQNYIIQAQGLVERIKEQKRRDGMVCEIVSQALRGAELAAQLTRPQTSGIRRTSRLTQRSPKVENPVSAPSPGEE